MVCLKITKTRMQNNKKSVKQETINHEIGDVVWAKVKGYPYWPAKITEEPKNDEQNKRKANKKIKEIFVSFFGVGLSVAWVQSKDILAYECDQKEELIKKAEKQQKLKTAIDDAEKFILLNSATTKLSIKPNEETGQNTNGLLSIDEELKLINGHNDDKMSENADKSLEKARHSQQNNSMQSKSSEDIEIVSNKSRKRERSSSVHQNGNDSTYEPRRSIQNAKKARLSDTCEQNNIYKTLTLIIDSNYKLTSHLIDKILNSKCNKLYIYSLNVNEDFDMLKDKRIKVTRDFSEAFSQELIISCISNTDNSLKDFEQKLFSSKIEKIKYINLSPQTQQDARFYHNFFNDKKWSYLEVAMIISNNEDDKIQLLAATYDKKFFDSCKYLLDSISNRQVDFKGKYLCLPNLLSSIVQPLILANKMFQIEISRILNQIKTEKNSSLDIGDQVIDESINLIKENVFNAPNNFEFFEDLSYSESNLKSSIDLISNKNVPTYSGLLKVINEIMF